MSDSVHADHLFADHSNDANGKPVIVLLIAAEDQLYIPAGLAGHHPYDSIYATIDVGEITRLSDRPRSPFDAADEIILVATAADEDQEFLVDSKYVAHYRECPECEGIWDARDAAYNSLDDAEKATASFFAITETNKGPYLVYAGDLEPTTS